MNAIKTKYEDLPETIKIPSELVQGHTMKIYLSGTKGFP
jgi:hypothetical protein